MVLKLVFSALAGHDNRKHEHPRQDTRPVNHGCRRRLHVLIPAAGATRCFRNVSRHRLFKKPRRHLPSD